MARTAAVIERLLQQALDPVRDVRDVVVVIMNKLILRMAPKIHSRRYPRSRNRWAWAGTERNRRENVISWRRARREWLRNSSFVAYYSDSD